MMSTQLEKEYHKPTIEKNPWLSGQEKLKYFVVRVFIVTDDGKNKCLLLFRRPNWSILDPDKWLPPGGNVNPVTIPDDIPTHGENLVDAIRRETREEVYYDGEPLVLDTVTILDTTFSPTSSTLTATSYSVIPLAAGENHTDSQFSLGEKSNNHDLRLFPITSIPLEDMAFEYGSDVLDLCLSQYPSLLPSLLKNTITRIITPVDNVFRPLGSPEEQFYYTPYLAILSELDEAHLELDSETGAAFDLKTQQEKTLASLHIVKPNVNHLLATLRNQKVPEIIESPRFRDSVLELEHLDTTIQTFFNRFPSSSHLGDIDHTALPA